MKTPVKRVPDISVPDLRLRAQRQGTGSEKKLVELVVYGALGWNGRPGEVASASSPKTKILPCGKSLLARMLSIVLKVVEPDQKLEGREVGRMRPKLSETGGRSLCNSRVGSQLL